jgi:AbiTii
MASIVLELQGEALDSQIKVSDLLRKALVMSRKLKAAELDAWTARELNGYSTDDSETVPPYRLLHGQVKAWHPLRGWLPVFFEDSSPLLSELAGRQPVDRVICWGIGQDLAESEIRVLGHAVRIRQGPAPPARS